MSKIMALIPLCRFLNWYLISHILRKKNKHKNN